MPKLLEWNGWKFFFYSREGMPLEPPHVHVRKDRSEAKIWLTPLVRVAHDRRMDPRTLKMLLSEVEQHRDEFEERWHDFFS
jgi:Domain of unknown function (DUF4160)